MIHQPINASDLIYGRHGISELNKNVQMKIISHDLS